jgi:hypothetical protein
MWRRAGEWHRKGCSTRLLNLQWDLESQLEIERDCEQTLGLVGCYSSYRKWPAESKGENSDEISII